MTFFNANLKYLSNDVDQLRRLKHTLQSGFEIDTILEALTFIEIENIFETDTTFRNKEKQKQQPQQKSLKIQKLEESQQQHAQQGFIDKKYLLKWINTKESEHSTCRINQKEFTIDEFCELFPVERISLTFISTHCLKGACVQNGIPITSSHLKATTSILSTCEELSGSSLLVRKNNRKTEKENTVVILALVHGIISRQLSINRLKKLLIPEIPKQIPMLDKNLTYEELNEYISCQANLQNANARSILEGLNGCARSVDGSNVVNKLFYEFPVAEKSRNVDEPYVLEDRLNQMNRISTILERLTNRVDNFGKEWLVAGEERERERERERRLEE